MWFLASAKIGLADQIGSQALRADAIESITCGYLSAVILLGLLAQLLFGVWWIDSLIELASAGVLLWRLTIELRQGAEFPEAIERRASNAAGALLFALAAYVVASAAYGLWAREGQEFSATGFGPGGIGDPGHVVAREGKNAGCRPDRQPRTSRRCRRVHNLWLSIRRCRDRAGCSAFSAGLVVGR